MSIRSASTPRRAVGDLGRSKSPSAPADHKELLVAWVQRSICKLVPFSTLDTAEMMGSRIAGAFDVPAGFPFQCTDVLGGSARLSPLLPHRTVLLLEVRQPDPAARGPAAPAATVALRRPDAEAAAAPAAPAAALVLRRPDVDPAALSASFLLRRADEPHRAWRRWFASHGGSCSGRTMALDGPNTLTKATYWALSSTVTAFDAEDYACLQLQGRRGNGVFVGVVPAAMWELPDKEKHVRQCGVLVPLKRFMREPPDEETGDEDLDDIIGIRVDPASGTVQFVDHGDPATNRAVAWNVPFPARLVLWTVDSGMNHGMTATWTALDPPAPLGARGYWDTLLPDTPSFFWPGTAPDVGDPEAQMLLESGGCWVGPLPRRSASAARKSSGMMVRAASGSHGSATAHDARHRPGTADRGAVAAGGAGTSETRGRSTSRGLSRDAETVRSGGHASSTHHDRGRSRGAAGDEVAHGHAGAVARSGSALSFTRHEARSGSASASLHHEARSGSATVAERGSADRDVARSGMALSSRRGHSSSDEGWRRMGSSSGSEWRSDGVWSGEQDEPSAAAHRGAGRGGHY